MATEQASLDGPALAIPMLPGQRLVNQHGFQSVYDPPCPICGDQLEQEANVFTRQMFVFYDFRVRNTMFTCSLPMPNQTIAA